MKSRIEVRKFAISKAVEIMGAGTPAKNVVSKAQEIESYIIGNAQLPETYDQEQALGDMFTKGISSVLGNSNVEH